MNNKKTIFKVIIDVIMIVMLILLMSMESTGEFYHEIIGIAIGIIAIIHVILNFSFMKKILPRLFKKEIPIKTKILAIIDLLIIIMMLSDVVMGIAISKSILTNITFGNTRVITSLHKFISAWLFILVSIHLGFHWNTIVLGFKKLFKITKENIVIKVICKVIYAIIGILGIIGLMKQSINQNFILKINNSNNTQPLTTNKDNQSPTAVTSSSSGSNGDTSANANSQNVSNDKDNSSNGKNTIQSTSDQTTVVTLSQVTSVDDYLGNLHCTGCGKHCILTNPQCSVGASQQQQAVTEYNTTYNTNETYSTQSSNKTLNNNSLKGKMQNSGKTMTTRDQNSNSTTRESNSQMSQKENYNNIKGNKEANGGTDNASIIDYISIMGFEVGGTYYLLKIAEKTKNK